MGTTKISTPSLGEALFTKTQRQIFGLLYGQPDKSFYANEIVRFAGVGIGTVQRELEKLSAVGLLTTRKIGNQKHYQANSQSPIFAELHGIVLKTFGMADLLTQALGEVQAKIEAAFIYGSVAKGSDRADSDIDLMIISGGLSYGEVFPLLATAEETLGRTINLSLYTPGEIRAKRGADNHFVNRVLTQPKVFLIGSADALG